MIDTGKSSRYAIQLPGSENVPGYRYASISDGMIMSRYGVGKRKEDAPAPTKYTSTNIFKVLRIRRRILNGEPVYKLKRGKLIPQYFSTCRCVRIKER